MKDKDSRIVENDNEGKLLSIVLCYVFLHFFKNACCVQTKSQKSFKFSPSNIYAWFYNEVKFGVNDL